MIEYERKYLVDVNSSNVADLLLRMNESRSDNIIQGYLSNAENCAVRVRAIINYVGNRSCRMTVKGPKVDGACTEIEFPIQSDHFDALFSMCSSTVTKTRCILNYDVFSLELDVFEGALAGLVMVEFESTRDLVEKTVREGLLPSWIGRDVTDDKFFSNVNLSTQTWDDVRQLIAEKYGDCRPAKIESVARI